MNMINFHHVRNLQMDLASGGSIAEEWSTDFCKNFSGEMIVSDARAFQSTLKMQIFAPPPSNFNLRVTHIF